MFFYAIVIKAIYDKAPIISVQTSPLTMNCIHTVS